VGIPLLEQQVRDRPDDVRVLTRLTEAYLQRARETGDPSYYDLAETALDHASKLAPEDVQVLVAAGSLALARHDFEQALAVGEQTRAANPDVVAAYGIIADALVELGRYEEAAAAVQEMVDRRPDFASYSRVSYVRELHGDLEGAIEAMETAAASAPSDFDEAWALVIVGNLQLQRADVAAAERAYSKAAQSLSGDAMVLAATARLAIARGDLVSAEPLLRAAVDQRPLPEYATALGELLESQGRVAEAEEQYAVVRATQQLFAASGVDNEVELTLFEADHSADTEPTYAQARTAHDRRPSIFAADTLAWAAYMTGRLDEARARSAEALRLGTRDPRLFYHAGVIAGAAGEIAVSESLLTQAIAMEPAQTPLYASAARLALSDLAPTAVH
jgi:pentatricopeptide repeat protein